MLIIYYVVLVMNISVLIEKSFFNSEMVFVFRSVDLSQKTIVFSRIALGIPVCMYVCWYVCL